MSSSTTAIIGAGMAGITAARALIAAGQTVQVFEKSRGSGGRLASKRSEMGRVNLGAQSFNAEDALFIEELQQWQQAGWVEQANLEQSLWPEQSHWKGIPYSSALTRNLLGNIETQFACEIRALSYINNGWLLHDQHAKVHGPFQQLIVAIPAPQAAVLLLDCVPELAAQAASVEMQPAWMVALGFKEPISLPNKLQQLENSSIVEIILTEKSAEHPMQTIMLRASLEWSRQHIEAEFEQAITALTQAFTDLLQTPLPAADSAFAHRWRYATGALPTTTALLSDPKRSLYIAGDWCGKGDVESAWQSGLQAAKQLLEDSASLK